MGAALAGCGMGRGFCWNGWDETCGSFVEEDEALLSSVCPGTFLPESAFGADSYRKTLHILIGMGSAALADAVAYPGKVTRLSSKGQRIPPKIKSSSSIFMAPF